MSRHIAGCITLCLSLVSPMTVQAEPGEIRPSYLGKQCEEDVNVLNVDPESVRPHVPAEHELSLNEGRVRVLLVAQDCPTYWFDGQDLGPTQEVHHWVAIDKGNSLRRVPGAQATLLTMSWYPVFNGSTNPKVGEYWIRSGTNAQGILGLEFSPLTQERSGEVKVSAAQGYSWTVEAKPPFARTVGVNHDLYGNAPNGESVFHRIQCLAVVTGWASNGRLEVNGNTDPAGLLTEGSYDTVVHTFERIWCQATLAEGN